MEVGSVQAVCAHWENRRRMRSPSYPRQWPTQSDRPVCSLKPKEYRRDTTRVFLMCLRKSARCLSTACKAFSLSCNDESLMPPEHLANSLSLGQEATRQAEN